MCNPESTAVLPAAQQMWLCAQLCNYVLLLLSTGTEALSVHIPAFEAVLWCCVTKVKTVSGSDTCYSLVLCNKGVTQEYLVAAVQQRRRQ